MINRLKSLEMQDFRVFLGSHRVPLDADIILIHGNNGTGKSSLLYAIELALTGSVADLAQYREDYPRCLRHIHGKGQSSAAVRFSEGKDVDCLSSTSINSSGSVQSSVLPDEVSRRFFVERCFLSQVQLSRLLEAYQTQEKGATETPIVGFIKRLLHLELLDNLLAALHEIEDIRRVRKAFPRFIELEDREDRIAKKLEMLRAEMNAAEERNGTRLKELQDLLNRAGIPVPVESWNLAQAISLKQLLKNSYSVEALASDLQRVGMILRDLRAAKVASSGDSREDESPKLEQEIRLMDISLAEIKKATEPVLASFHQLLSKSLPSIRRLPSALPAEDLSFLEESAKDALSQLRSTESLIQSQEASRRTQAGNKQLLEVRLEEIKTQIDAITQSLPSWADALTEISKYIENNECPVCERNFGETNSGSLKDRVSARVRLLGSQAASLVTFGQEREKLNLDLKQADLALDALNQRLSQSPDSSIIAKSIAEIESSRAKLESIRDACEESSRLWREISETKSRLRMSKAVHEQWTKVKELVLASAAGLNHPLMQPDGVGASIDSLLIACEQRINTTESQLALGRQLNELTDDIVSQFKMQGERDKEWVRLDLQLADVAKIRKNVDAYMNDCKQLRRTVMSAKQRLIDSVCNERLNRLWGELFERLTRHETFRPQLSEPKIVRDKLKAPIQGVAQGVTHFENISAVHSQGNLNTTAISLFLSLNLIERVRNRVLIIDDPVQCMDDVHTTQMALLLRELVDQGGRQVIVAVHERALFDYLRFELAPKKQGRKTIAISLTKSTDEISSSVHSEVLEWSPDEVNVEEEPATRVAS